jgi:hypothetical protein
MSLDSSKSDPPAPRAISDSDVETPRGGFMARPGLKAPPRHAVIVRCGDAPEPEEIPVARSSFLPPPPLEPEAERSNEKVTLRAIPTARVPQLAVAIAAPSTLPSPARALESAPPPSDAPVVVERASPVPQSRRARRSRLTILAAAAAGLLLGIVSVITTVQVREAVQSAPAAALPAGVDVAQASQGELRVPPAARAPSSAVSAAPAREASPVTSTPAPPAATPRSAAKRSIF